MPGRPVLRRLEKQIANEGGDEFLLAQVASGLSIDKIMRPFNLCRTMFYQWVHNGGPEREAAWAQAKVESADALVEDGLNLLDDLADTVDPTSAQVSLAGHRANYRKWLAATRNRAVYGEDKSGVSVNLNIGQLHLDALRVAGRAETPEIQDAEYDLLSDGEEA